MVDDEEAAFREHVARERRDLNSMTVATGRRSRVSAQNDNELTIISTYYGHQTRDGRYSEFRPRYLP